MRFIEKENREMGMRMFQADCRRFLSVKKLLIGILLICAICVLAIADNIAPNALDIPVEMRVSVVDKLQESLLFDRYKSLLVLSASLCIVSAFAEDYQNHYFRYLMIRSTVNAYVVSKVLVFMCYILITVIGGFLLTAVLLSPVMNIPGGKNYFFGVYQKLVEGNGAWLYLMLMAFNFALSVIPVCNIGMMVSVWKPSAYVAVGSTFFAYYLLYAATGILPWFLSYSELSSSPDVTGVAALLYRILVFAVLIIWTGKGIRKSLLWRNHEGTL